MSATSRGPVLAIHGGAGTITADKLDERAVRAALRAALQAGFEVLRRNGAAIDAVEAAVRSLEDCGWFNAGKGAARDSEGMVTLDAAIMDGRGLRVGGVAAVRGVKNPIAAARLVLDQTPHVLLAGDGARELAHRFGLPLVEDAYFQRLGGAGVEPKVRPAPTPGTVGAVALDHTGGLAAATSTGGLTGKLPGRVGDSPIPGAGTWADERCAVSATGLGEFFMRTGFGFRVGTAVAAGLPLASATERALAAAAALGGSGGCVAVSASGDVAMPFDTPGMFRAVADGGKGPRGAIFAGPLAPL